MKHQVSKKIVPVQNTPKPTKTNDKNNMLFYSLVALSSVTLTTLGYFGYKYYKRNSNQGEEDEDITKDLEIEISSSPISYPTLPPRSDINENKLEIEELPSNDEEL